MRHGAFATALHGALFVALCTTGAQAVDSSVLCRGVNAPGNNDYFAKASYQAFWGAKGRDSEMWVDNHTHANVFVEAWFDGGDYENAVLDPTSTKTIYFPNDQDVTGFRCTLWSGQQLRPPRSGTVIIPTTPVQNIPAANDPPLIANDPAVDPIDPAVDPYDYGGVAVDVDPSRSSSALDSGLNSAILGTL